MTVKIKTNSRTTQRKLNRLAKRRFSAATCSALGEILADAAFTAGDGVKASRLVFLLDNGNEYGGWARGPLARHLAKVLEAQNS